MAAEDFGGKVLGRPIEVIGVDHQNKPDIGSGLARQLVDQRGVTAFVLGGASSVGLGVQAYAKERKITTMVTGGYASQFSGPAARPTARSGCPRPASSPTRWRAPWYRAAARPGPSSPRTTCSGHGLAADAGKAVKAAGGKVLGEIRHPLGATDLSSQLIQAQSSGAT